MGDMNKDGDTMTETHGNRTETHACDLISRQAAIDAINQICPIDTEYDCTLLDRVDVRCVLTDLPSAQPEQRWIPCGERMPEDYTDVLVWFEYYRYGDYNCLYQMHGIGNYMSEYDSWMINHETGWRKLRVFAWMPLPEPWKGDKE